MNTYKKAPFALVAVLLLTACVDPYHLETNTFESALVVEATITNELKQQQIKVARTFRFEEDGPTFEAGADVEVTASDGTTYSFEENNGMYVSEQPFQAGAGVEYTLNITTSDGKNYTSKPAKFSGVSTISGLTSSVITNSNGERGVQIAVSSFDPTSTSNYYRYSYEETYKVIVPLWSSRDLEYNNVTDQFVFTQRDPNSKVCYHRNSSNTILQTSTIAQSEDRVENHPVRFISKSDPKISHRYSILVKQYIQSLEAYTFYETLKKMSGTGSILSQSQPGFFEGNIVNSDDPDEKIVGFFDVSSVSDARLFFNYSDVFTGEPLPDYFIDCELQEFDTELFTLGRTPKERLIYGLDNNTLVYYSGSGTVFYMVVPACGDCTSFSSNIIPAFWTE